MGATFNLRQHINNHLPSNLNRARPLNQDTPSTLNEMIGVWTSQSGRGNVLSKDRMYSPGTTNQQFSMDTTTNHSRKHSQRGSNLLSLPTVMSKAGRYSANYRQAMNLDSSRFKKSFLGKGGPWGAEDVPDQPPFLAASDIPTTQGEPEKILREDYIVVNPSIIHEGAKMSEKVIHSS